MQVWSSHPRHSVGGWQNTYMKQWNNEHKTIKIKWQANLARVGTIACTIVTVLARLQAIADSSSSSWASVAPPPPPPLALPPHLLPLLLLMVYLLPYEMKSMSLALFHFYLLAHSPTKITYLLFCFNRSLRLLFSIFSILFAISSLFSLLIGPTLASFLGVGGITLHQTKPEINQMEKKISKETKENKSKKCLLFFLCL